MVIPQSLPKIVPIVLFGAELGASALMWPRAKQSADRRENPPEPKRTKYDAGGGDEVGDENVLDEEEAADELLAAGPGALVPVPDGGTGGGADAISVHLLGGRITHCPSKGGFEAACCSPKQRTGATTRTSKAGADGPHGVMTLGRLWDFMASWLT